MPVKDAASADVALVRGERIHATGGGWSCSTGGVAAGASMGWTMLGVGLAFLWFVRRSRRGHDAARWRSSPDEARPDFGQTDSTNAVTTKARRRQ
jgi:MYXO-CTERM domain-containing protein